MQCPTHGEKRELSTCDKCGATVCAQCAVELGVKNMCKLCLDTMLEKRRGTDDTDPT